MLGHGATGQFSIGQVSAGGTAETITLDKWYAGLSLPVRIKPGLSAGAQRFTSFHPVPLVSFAWYAGLSDPVRIKPALPAGEQQFTAFNSQPFVPFAWFNELSKPQRLDKPGLGAAAQQFLAFYPAPSPFVATGWFNWLSEPVRQKAGLLPGQQQFLAFNAQPFVSFSWFGALAEPVRLKPGLHAARQSFFAIDEAVIPTTKLIEWFAALSEPVRLKQGLRAWHQQFLAYHPRILPTPTITGTMNLIETKDTMLAGGTEFNRPVTAKVGFIENAFSGIAGLIERSS